MESRRADESRLEIQEVIVRQHYLGRRLRAEVPDGCAAGEANELPDATRHSWASVYQTSPKTMLRRCRLLERASPSERTKIASGINGPPRAITELKRTALDLQNEQPMDRMEKHKVGLAVRLVEIRV
jgi:hypothetical protein